MLTAEIKVNGRLVEVVTIRNIGGDSGPKLEGVADYGCWVDVVSGDLKGCLFHGEIKDWDRSRPAHELVHAAIEAIMEARK